MTSSYSYRQRQRMRAILGMLLLYSLAGCSKPRPAAGTNEATTPVAPQMQIASVGPSVSMQSSRVRHKNRACCYRDFNSWKDRCGVEGRLWFSDPVGNKMLAVILDGKPSSCWIDHS